jgi:hypothetical protein
MKEELRFSETLILTRATWRNIPENGILHSHHSENLKSYIVQIRFENIRYHLKKLNKVEVKGQ